MAIRITKLTEAQGNLIEEVVEFLNCETDVDYVRGKTFIEFQSPFNCDDIFEMVEEVQDRLENIRDLDYEGIEISVDLSEAQEKFILKQDEKLHRNVIKKLLPFAYKD